MATADEYIEVAASYIGVSGTDNIFNTWYWGYHCYDPNTYPWCAAFQSYVGVHDLGMPFYPSASAAGVANQGDRVSFYEAVRGDWVLFNWDGRGDFGWADHIGVVEWVDYDSGYFGTIEGNCNDTVTRVTRSAYSSYSVAFFRPPYEPPKPEEDEDLKPVYNEGGSVYRLYNSNEGLHHFTLDPSERDSLVNDGWASEGIAFTAPRGGINAVYRLYNPNSGDHILTCDFYEAAEIQKAGWQYEFVPFFAQADGSGTPVYRFFNPNTGHHMYTADNEERNALNSAGWVEETGFTV